MTLASTLRGKGHCRRSSLNVTSSTPTTTTSFGVARSPRIEKRASTVETSSRSKTCNAYGEDREAACRQTDCEEETGAETAASVVHATITSSTSPHSSCAVGRRRIRDNRARAANRRHPPCRHGPRVRHVGVAHAGGNAAGSGPLLGITGNLARFQGQTGQASTVDQAFLGWEQGRSYGSSFAVLFQTHAPIPMIHLGTKGRNGREAITPGGIASGQGDAYLVALNEAIAVWGKGIYIRPMAEMNSASTAYSGYLANGRPRDAAHSPASYRKAFARIYVILHGGTASAVNAKLQQLGLPPLKGGDLPVNPFPRLRIVWSPLASDNPRVPGNAAAQYYPGAAFVDVEGGDIYDEHLTDTAPWQGLEHLYSAARSRNKPFSVPEWGLFQLDDPAFVQHMCTFLKTHGATEIAAFYESRPASIFDLESKPRSRAAYRGCITRSAGSSPTGPRSASRSRSP